jgi:hypothetical protein
MKLYELKDLIDELDGDHEVVFECSIIDGDGNCNLYNFKLEDVLQSQMRKTVCLQFEQQLTE